MTTSDREKFEEDSALEASITAEKGFRPNKITFGQEAVAYQWREYRGENFLPDGHVTQYACHWSTGPKDAEALYTEAQMVKAYQAGQQSSDDRDAERLDYLIKHEQQVWECCGRYSIHDVTEHYPTSNKEYPSARAAIDAAIEEGSK